MEIPREENWMWFSCSNSALDMSFEIVKLLGWQNSNKDSKCILPHSIAILKTIWPHCENKRTRENNNAVFRQLMGNDVQFANDLSGRCTERVLK